MKVKQKPAFDANAFLRSAGAGKSIVTYQRRDVIFSQGDASDTVLYIQKGAVKLSVLSHGSKEAVVGMLGPGDFLGERALTGQHALSDRFITYILARNSRIQADLVDQLFNASEKRLARTLLLLAGYGKPDQTHRVLPRISQETLAEMIGAAGAHEKVAHHAHTAHGHHLHATHHAGEAAKAHAQQHGSK